MAKWDVEYTDTFGGEANYSWVRRATVETKPNASRPTIMRAAKAALGLTGLRGRTADMGDTFEFRPYRSCTVLFVTWHDPVLDARSYTVFTICDGFVSYRRADGSTGSDPIPQNCSVECVIASAVARLGLQPGEYEVLPK